MPWLLPLDALMVPDPVPWYPHNIPYLAEEHRAIPVGGSDRSKGVFPLSCRLDLPRFFFFFLALVQDVFLSSFHCLFQ